MWRTLTAVAVLQSARAIVRETPNPLGLDRNVYMLDDGPAQPFEAPEMDGWEWSEPPPPADPADASWMDWAFVRGGNWTYHTFSPAEAAARSGRLPHWRGEHGCGMNAWSTKFFRAFGDDMGPEQIRVAYGHFCLCSKPDKGLEPPGSKWGEWRFRAASGPEPPRDAAGPALCEGLGGRRVYIVGDSTVRQQAAVLANDVAATGGDCANDVRFVFSDLLIAKPFPRSSNQRPGSATLHDTLVHLVNGGHGDDVVVFTVGPHCNDMTSYAAILRRLRSVILRFRREVLAPRGLRMQIMWRTIMPPHGNCTLHQLPWSSAEDLPGWYRREANGERERMPYGFWMNAFAYDRLAASTLRDAVDHLLDVSPLYLRPDAHTFDCLHVCVHKWQGSPLSYLARPLLGALQRPDRLVQ